MYSYRYDMMTYLIMQFIVQFCFHLLDIPDCSAIFASQSISQSFIARRTTSVLTTCLGLSLLKHFLGQSIFLRKMFFLPGKNATELFITWRRNHLQFSTPVVTITRAWSLSMVLDKISHYLFPWFSPPLFYQSYLNIPWPRWLFQTITIRKFRTFRSSHLPHHLQH